MINIVFVVEAERHCPGPLAALAARAANQLLQVL